MAWEYLRVFWLREQTTGGWSSTFEIWNPGARSGDRRKVADEDIRQYWGVLLDEFGADGWELVTETNGASRMEMYWTFKRPRQSARPGTGV